MSIDSCKERAKDDKGVEHEYLCHTAFFDDFENGIQFTEEKWHKKNLQTSHGNPGSPLSYVETSTERAHTGKYSLKTHTAEDKNDLQKSGLIRALLFYPPESDFYYSAWYFIPSGIPTKDLYLFELQTTKYQNVGRRIVIGDPNGDSLYIAAKIDTGEIFYQSGTPTPFPKDAWVNVKLHMHLSPSTDGVTELWQDGKKILEGHGKNMPSNQYYDWISVGQTANATHHAQTIYIDDVVVSDKPIP